MQVGLAPTLKNGSPCMKESLPVVGSMVNAVISLACWLSPVFVVLVTYTNLLLLSTTNRLGPTAVGSLQTIPPTSDCRIPPLPVVYGRIAVAAPVWVWQGVAGPASRREA